MNPNREFLLTKNGTRRKEYVFRIFREILFDDLHPPEMFSVADVDENEVRYMMLAASWFVELVNGVEYKYIRFANGLTYEYRNEHPTGLFFKRAHHLEG